MISVIFVCRGRPSLTELCLRRLRELMPEPYELVVACHNRDEEYIEMLNSVGDPDVLVSDSNQWRVLNKALESATGDYFMRVENDFYWSKPGCVETALKAFIRYPELGFIRFEWIPFKDYQCSRFLRVNDTVFGVLKKDTPYAFNLNPHIRRERFPVGVLPEVYPQGVHDEAVMAKRWTGTSACMKGEHFRHIGIYDEGGHYKPYYAERFHLREGDTEIEPWTEFCGFCENKEYRTLFRRYLDANGYESP